MSPYHQLLLVEGRYRIVALTYAPDAGPDAILAYAVTDLAGDPLCREATFEAARAWLQARCAHDALAHDHKRPRCR
jgi:hypothetical protein